MSTTPELGEGILNPGGKGTCQLHKMPQKTGSGESLTSRGRLSYNMSKYFEYLVFFYEDDMLPRLSRCFIFCGLRALLPCFVSPCSSNRNGALPVGTDLKPTGSMYRLMFFLYEGKYICIFITSTTQVWIRPALNNTSKMFTFHFIVSKTLYGRCVYKVVI